MRFCHGDSPMRQMEAGQQKGGTIFALLAQLIVA